MTLKWVFNPIHPSFFISKKVEICAPELKPGGYACNLNNIFDYHKLKIGSRRDFRDFAIFYLLPVFPGLEPSILRFRDQFGVCRVIHSAMESVKIQELPGLKFFCLPYLCSRGRTVNALAFGSEGPVFEPWKNLK